MIGGHDISFHTETSAQATEGTIRILRASWRNSVVENAETGEFLGPVFFGFEELPSEVLIYKNAAAHDSWAAHGATPENANLMVHIIRGENSMTLVVDDPNAAEMRALIAAIYDHVHQDIFWMRADAA